MKKNSPRHYYHFLRECEASCSWSVYPTSEKSPDCITTTADVLWHLHPSQVITPPFFGWLSEGEKFSPVWMVGVLHHYSWGKPAKRGGKGIYLMSQKGFGRVACSRVRPCTVHATLPNLLREHGKKNPCKLLGCTYMIPYVHMHKKHSPCQNKSAMAL